MKMNQKYMFSLFVTSLFLLVSCGAGGKDSDKTTNKASKSKAAVIEAYDKSIQDTFLEGKVTGDVNGKAFSFYNKKEGPGKIRKSNSGKHLNLTFSTLPTLVLTMNVLGYKGADTYVSGSSFKVINFKNPKGKFKNKDDSKLIITEDNDTHVKGSISFATVSEKNEDIVINAKFDLTKLVIDLNDQDALLKVIKDKPDIIESLGDLKSDKEFILKAMSISSAAFNYADKSLKGDRDFILKVMQGNPKKSVAVLMFADKELKSDKVFALKAVKINIGAFYFLDKKLKKDKVFVLKALKINPEVYSFFDKTLIDDKDFILKAIKINIRSLQQTRALRKDKDFAMKAMKTNIEAFRYLDKTLKKDKDFVLKALKINIGAFKYLGKKLKKDKDIIAASKRK